MRFRPRLNSARPSHVSGDVSPSWRTSLYATCLAQGTAMVAFGFVLPFLPLYLREIGVGPESAVVFWSGTLVTSTAVALAIASPIWGVIADRRGRKVMVLRAMIVGGVILALMGAVQNVFELLGLRILQGAFTGTIAASTALVATTVPRERLAYSMGLLQTSAYLGISAGPVLGGVIAEAVGIRGSFFVAGALLILACLGAACFMLPQAFARNIGLFLLLRAGLGVFFGVLIPATNVIVGLSTPGSMRGSAYGLTSSATAVGNAIGPLLGSAFAASLGLPSIFIVTAVVLTLLGVWVAALVREPAPQS